MFSGLLFVFFSESLVNAGSNCLGYFCNRRGSIRCFDFNEFVSVNLHRRIGLAFGNSVRHGGNVKANSANRIVVTGDDIIDASGIAIGVDDTEDRNTEFIRFTNSNVFVLDVYDENRIGQSAHIFDPTETALQFVHHTGAL